MIFIWYLYWYLYDNDYYYWYIYDNDYIIYYILYLFWYLYDMIVYKYILKRLAEIERLFMNSK